MGGFNGLWRLIGACKGIVMYHMDIDERSDAAFIADAAALAFWIGYTMAVY